jgi:cysteine-rich repeat protein
MRLAIFFLVLGAATHSAAECVAVDGNVQVGEECDGTNVGGYQCTDLCFTGQRVGSGLKCAADCTFDTSDCCVCGDNRIEPAPTWECNEKCDCTGSCTDWPSSSCTGTCSSPLLGGMTCKTLPSTSGGPFLEGGALGCKPTCDDWDTTGCFVCGNGRKEGPEQCDGNDCGGGLLCNSNSACTGPWPEHGGPLFCSPGGNPWDAAHQYPNGCKISHDSCWTCGNGVIDPGTYTIGGVTYQEQCDDGGTCVGGSAAGTHCTSASQCPGGQCLPQDDGTCSSACQVMGCGNGLVEATETCDDGNTTANDGCSTCAADMYHFGGNGEGWDQCMMRWVVEAPYVSFNQANVTEQANGFTVTCRDNVSGSCDQDTTANQCTFEVFYCTNVSPVQVGACSYSDVDLLEILPATTLDTTAKNAVLDSFEDTFRRIGSASTINRVSATSLDPVPAVTKPRMCGKLLVSFPRPTTTTTNRVLALRVTDSGGRRDTDQITFVCTP